MRESENVTAQVVVLREHGDMGVDVSRIDDDRLAAAIRSLE